jgi:hypothetical protein
MLLLAFVTTGLFSTISAQKSSVAAVSNLPNLSSEVAAQNSKTSAAAVTSKANDNTNKPAATTKGGDTPTTTAASRVVITGGDAGSTNSAVPHITASGTEAASGGLTGLPKLPAGGGSYTIPEAQVPPTADAPYMQNSTLPAGTVFIAVGSVLGFLALAVFLWRMLAVWALKRNVKRAAMQQHMSDSKPLFRTPAAPMYKYSDQDRNSTLSLGHLANKKNKSRPSTAVGPAPTASLFFSPTAGAAGSGMHAPGNRASNYLPSGYYASGSAAPGNGTGMAHIGGGQPISLSNLGPHIKGYNRAQSMGTTPPDSPDVHPQPGHAGSMSTSTLDLSRRPEGRAPSAYLDDLFDEAGARPGVYPREGMTLPPSGTSPLGRF